MNGLQNIFAIFFAIFWGTMAGSLPRWKAFQYPLICRIPEVTRRVSLSFVLLNLFPILFFGWTMWVLKDRAIRDPWTVWTISQIITHSVIPAISVFGFYRLWLAIIEFCPRTFYREFPHEVLPQYRKNEPTIAELWYPDTGDRYFPYTPIAITTGSRNLIVSLVYIAVAFGAPFIPLS